MAAPPLDIRSCGRLADVPNAVAADTVVFLVAVGQMPPDTAWRVACYAWQSLQRVVPAEACEDRATGSAVAAMRQRAAAVVGLTARHCDLAVPTHRQLREARVRACCARRLRS